MVVRRLLKFYNDLANQYEILLSNLDGRVVGGAQGPFRYDDQSHTVSEFSEITNDIDDRVKLYDQVGLSSLSPLVFTSTPVYAFMYEPNALSRLFPTQDPFVTAALNGNVTPVTDFGKTLGSLGVSSITSVGTMTSSRAAAKFYGAVPSGSDTVVLLSSNGDAGGRIPALSTGQKVFMHLPDGSRVNSVSAAVVVTGSGPFSVRVAGVAFPGRVGSLVQDTSDATVASNHFYTPGRDLRVNNDDGQITNISFPLPAPFDGSQVPIAGNELVDCSLTFSNSSTAPRRIPSLDGLELADDGRVQVPPLSRPSESELLAAESACLSFIGTAKVQPDFVTVTDSTVAVSVGQTFRFVNGPNAGPLRTVATVVSGTSFTVAVPFLFQDAGGSDFYAVSPSGDLQSILASELAVTGTNVAASPVPPALIGPVDSEISAVGPLVRGLGIQQASGTGSTDATPNVLLDPSVDFTACVPPVTSSSVVYVPSGAATGVYKVASAAPGALTLDPALPYSTIPTSTPGIPYYVISPMSLLSDKGQRLAAEFLSRTLAFFGATSAWASSMSAAGVPARQAAVTARLADVASYVSRISGVLRDDRIYETRFLWIQQRTDKKDGTLTRQVLARKRREEAAVKLLADQQRLLVAEALS